MRYLTGVEWLRAAFSANPSAARLAAFAGLAWSVCIAAGCQSPAGNPLHPRILLNTNRGSVTLELDAERAPLTVVNFVQYVQDAFYDGTVFHRVVRDGLIQGGAYTPDMSLRTTGLREGIRDESQNGLKCARGTIAMVRGPERPNSATSQFFINVSDNGNLDVPGRDGESYTVFGTVVEGMKVVDRISGAPLYSHPGYAAGRLAVVPRSPVVIRRATLLTEFDAEAARDVARQAKLAAKRAVEEAAAAAERAFRERLDEIEREYGALTTTESGLKYVDIRVGSGVPPEPHSMAEILYTVTLVDGTEVESTRNAEPKASTMKDAIKGVREGLLGMREGGKRLLVIPPELGFGEFGIPSRIPPNSTLFFEIELLAVR